MSSARVRWDGLDELKDQLRRLPEQLRAEGSAIVHSHATAAQQDIVDRYPDVSGRLRAGVRVTLDAVSRFGAGAVIKSAAKHAWLFEHGSAARKAGPPKKAKHITPGAWPANRGRMPAAPVDRQAIPVLARWRRCSSATGCACRVRSGGPDKNAIVMTTRDVTNALIATLGADAELLQLLPHGVYRAGRAPEGSTALVEVALVSSSDVPMFGGRAFEDLRYLVQAIQRIRRGEVSNVGAALARIDAVLEDGTLPTLTGAGVCVMQRRAYFEDDTIVDERDPSLVWDACGGYYEVIITAASASITGDLGDEPQQVSA